MSWHRWPTISNSHGPCLINDIPHFASEDLKYDHWSYHSPCCLGTDCQGQNCRWILQFDKWASCEPLLALISCGSDSDSVDFMHWRRCMNIRLDGAYKSTCKKTIITLMAPGLALVPHCLDISRALRSSSKMTSPCPSRLRRLLSNCRALGILQRHQVMVSEDLWRMKMNVRIGFVSVWTSCPEKFLQEDAMCGVL